MPQEEAPIWGCFAGGPLHDVPAPCWDDAVAHPYPKDRTTHLLESEPVTPPSARMGRSHGVKHGNSHDHGSRTRGSISHSASIIPTVMHPGNAI